MMMSSKAGANIAVHDGSEADKLLEKLKQETGSLLGGLDALEKGRGFAWKQALVQCAIVLARSKAHLDASTLIHVFFWIVYSAWGAAHAPCPHRRPAPTRCISPACA
eukprot:1904358-Prymnesium_polylepis.1